ncbi:MAG: PTS sugar transporter subunit IIB [Liquorilactobacillus hordei]|uniref:PTS galactitol transporter subunit IIB n=1 Tax=Liquorilactobacillus hordei TaxID=468911 RepID=A0A3S6QLR1_9LACO|nr:PTS sugar transporter subunit IIB [Liquorilactobacillus hordei]AUJ28854.1 PTS galactitol transporter subunit IIB [Liquorilactobacillus hordei]
MVARILVACGNGIATSTVVASKIKSFLADKNITVETTQTKLMEVPSKVENYDLLVTTGQFEGKTHNVPYVHGLPILTGVGAENTLNEIYDVIKDK